MNQTIPANWTFKQKAYLVEPVEVTQSGSIRGKTLRTYEVNVYDEIRNGSSRNTHILPTGTIYQIKDGDLVKSTTKATLDNKYVGWGQSIIEDKVVIVNGWRSMLFTNQYVAVASKQQTMNSKIAAWKTQAEAQLKAMEKSASQIPDISAFTAEYPEYFI